MAQQEPGSVTLTIGRAELRIRGGYETASITNDFLAGVFFLVGSVLFFSNSTESAAIWCFTLGSVLFVARPAIRLIRRSHLGRISATDPNESARDF